MMNRISWGWFECFRPWKTRNAKNVQVEIGSKYPPVLYATAYNDSMYLHSKAADAINRDKTEAVVGKYVFVGEVTIKQAVEITVEELKK